MKDTLLEKINQSHNKIALIDNNQQMSYQQLHIQVNRWIKYLSSIKAKRVVAVLDNSCDWVLIDLACQTADICFIPLPVFFSTTQISHVINASVPDLLLLNNSSPIYHPIHEILIHNQYNQKYLPACPTDNLLAINLTLNIKVQLPDNTTKITFTSGSTGTPKGVCLSSENQLIVAQSLVERVAIKSPRHLCLLPLSTLLENIAGVYAPLIAGGTVILPSSKERGLSGSSMLNPKQLLSTISHYSPETLIMVPELLLLFVNAVEQGWKTPDSLKFIAVGGGKISPHLLEKATRMALPVFEGYGLSEASSVVCLCSPRRNQIGSVGKSLSGIKLTIENKEIVITGNIFLGYLNKPESWNMKKLYTGDLGQVDTEGFVTIPGRKKNQLISSFGRNINPEWVESDCLQNGLLQQCVLLGENRPYCVALIYPQNKILSDNSIQKWLTVVNQDLPDYAQIKNWYRLPEALSHKQGLMTENNRPRRQRIAEYYKNEIDTLYLHHCRNPKTIRINSDIQESSINHSPSSAETQS